MFAANAVLFWTPEEAAIWTAEDRTVKTRAALKRVEIAPFGQGVVG